MQRIDSLRSAGPIKTTFFQSDTAKRLGGIPLGGIPLGGIPLGGIPLGGIPLGGVSG